MSKVTQSEIAKHLGVSRSAVATVLSNSPSSRISAELRQRILDTAKALGYVPNRFAQIMSKGRSGMIGVISFGILEQLPQIKIKKAVYRILQKGYQPVVDNALWFADHGQAVCSRMIQMQVEGVVLIHPPVSFNPSYLKMLLDANIPVVGLGCKLSGITRYLSDKEYGFHRLTTHLLESGYRRLTLLIGQDTSLRKKDFSWHSTKAQAGFKRAIAEYKGDQPVYGDVHIVKYHLKPPKAQGDSFDNGTYLPGYYGMKEVLNRPLLPEVVLCSNDSWAMGAMAACNEADVRIPEDVAITGFEDDPQGRFGMLPLTSFSHPVDKIVDHGIGVLMEAIRNGTPTPDQLYLFSGELVIRKSTPVRLPSSQLGSVRP